MAGLRIIGGEARGRRLKTPRGYGVRPTSARVREAIFNVLGGEVSGRQVLDLFAGVGALGLEALSRGAAFATFVEVDRRVASILAENIRNLGYVERSRIVREDVRKALPNILTRQGAHQGSSDDESAAGSRWEGVAFADPPYRRGFVAVVIRLMAPVLAKNGWLIIEHSAEETPADEALPAGIRRIDRRRYGETVVSYFVGTEEGMG